MKELLFSVNSSMWCITVKRFSLLFILIVCFGLEQGLAAIPSSTQIKQWLLEIYQSHQKTFFCEEPFSQKGHVQYHGCQSCPPITLHIQWMPIVPLEQIANNLTCFREKICLDKKGLPFKGLRCCQLSNSHFQLMKADLHNLVPELPTFCHHRRLKRFAVFAKEETQTKGCHYFVDHKNKLIDPSPRVRGMIARAYLYMRTRYALSLDSDELALYLQWHQQYPVTQWERERNLKIQQYQGNSNPYVG